MSSTVDDVKVLHDAMVEVCYDAILVSGHFNIYLGFLQATTSGLVGVVWHCYTRIRLSKEVLSALQNIHALHYS